MKLIDQELKYYKNERKGSTCESNRQKIIAVLESIKEMIHCQKVFNQLWNYDADEIQSVQRVLVNYTGGFKPQFFYNKVTRDCKSKITACIKEIQTKRTIKELYDSIHPYICKSVFSNWVGIDANCLARFMFICEQLRLIMQATLQDMPTKSKGKSSTLPTLSE